MAKVTLSGDWKSYQAAMDALLKHSSDFRPLYKEAGEYMVGTGVPMRFRTKPGWPPVNRFGSPAKPLQDTGRLRDSVSYNVTPTGVEIGTPLIYAKIHNEGGVIKAQGKKFLAIPNWKTLTKSECRNSKPRDFPNTFIRKNAAGQLWIYQTMDDGTVRAIFHLVKSVKISQREFLTWTDSNIATILRRWTERLSEAT